MGVVYIYIYIYIYILCKCSKLTFFCDEPSSESFLSTSSFRILVLILKSIF